MIEETISPTMLLGRHGLARALLKEVSGPIGRSIPLQSYMAIDPLLVPLTISLQYNLPRNPICIGPSTS